MSHSAPLQPASRINPPPYYNRVVEAKDGMAYVRLGKSGAVVSRICLGLMSYAQIGPGEERWFEWMLPQEDSEPFVQQALEAGITFFDTAEIYSDGRSEKFFGQALKKLLPASRFTREDLFIATKVHPARTLAKDSAFGGIQKGLSRKAIFAAVEGSLERLQLDYIDLYFIHRFDYNTAIEETMEALHDLVKLGKIRYLGASAMFLHQFARMQHCAEKHGWTPFSAMQNHYNAIYREEEREIIPWCVESGVACVPYSPLASGVLCRPADAEDTARAKSDSIQKMKYYKAGDELVVQAVREVATKRGVPQAQVALAWVLQKAGVAAPIIGATKPHHIADAVAALQLHLTEEEVNAIEAAYQPHNIVGPV